MSYHVDNPPCRLKNLSERNGRYNSRSFKYSGVVSKLERRLDTAKLFLKDFVIASERDNLESYRKKAQMDHLDFLDDSIENPESNNPIPENIDELNTLIIHAISKGYANAERHKEDDAEVDFDVIIGENNKYIQISPKEPVDRDHFENFNIGSAFHHIMTDLSQIDIGMSNDERETLDNGIQELLIIYHDAMDSNIQNGTLFLMTNDDTYNVAKQIYDILEQNNLSGSKAKDNYEQIFNRTGSMRKKFNLKKHADKLYDSIRERNIQMSPVNELQYITRHPKSIQEFEDAYIEDYIWRNSVMDKYYPERIGDDGEYEGGYIEDRFVVHKNTEGNSMRVRLDGKTPDRPECYNTERRLEIMRSEKGRGYEPSDGTPPEQQSKKVAYNHKKGSFKISMDFGLYKVDLDDGVHYFDTQDDIESFKQSNLKKKSPTQ